MFTVKMTIKLLTLIFILSLLYGCINNRRCNIDKKKITYGKLGLEYYDRYLVSETPQQKIHYLNKLIQLIKKFENREYCKAGSLIKMYARLALVYKEQNDKYNSDIAFYKSAYWYLRFIENKNHIPKLSKHQIIKKYKKFFKERKIFDEVRSIDKNNLKKFLRKGKF